MRYEFTSHADVLAILADPRFAVPSGPGGGPPGGMAWLRANVARFSTGADHARRRAHVTSDLARMSPAALRRLASERAGGPLDLVARTVPAGLLAEALGVATVPIDAVAAAALAYHPHTEAGPAADRAVADLVDAFGGTPDEATAARIGLLIQTYDATAGLIGNALARSRPGILVDALLAETLRHDPPVRVTRRVAMAPAWNVPAGALVLLDLATANLPFGAEPRPCPGRYQALAIAAGVIEADR